MSIASLALALLYLPFPAPSRLVLGNLAAWTHGACIVYPSPVFDPPAIVDAVIAGSLCYLLARCRTGYTRCAWGPPSVRACGARD